MPRFLLCLIGVLLLVTPVAAATHSLFEGGLEMEIPAVLRALDALSIEQMFAASKTRPQAVFATPDSQTRLSLSYTEAPLDPEDLEETRTVLRTKMEAAPLNWVRDEIITLHGRLWFRLDYDIQGSGAAKRETILGTSLRGRLLFIVISTPLEDHELMAADLESVIESLRILP